MSAGLHIKPTPALLRSRKLLKGQSAQVYVDSSVVRMMAPYTPFKSGTLRDSPYASTNFGSGVVRQSTPYARRQYYDTRLRHRGLGSARWFQVMKAHGGVRIILREVRKITGAKNG